VIEAHARGEDIQILMDGKWVDLLSNQPSWNCHPDVYRVKPVPRYTVVFFTPHGTVFSTVLSITNEQASKRLASMATGYTYKKYLEVM
jgi:hypothetical protein